MFTHNSFIVDNVWRCCFNKFLWISGIGDQITWPWVISTSDYSFSLCLILTPTIHQLLAAFLIVKTTRFLESLLLKLNDTLEHLVRMNVSLLYVGVFQATVQVGVRNINWFTVSCCTRWEWWKQDDITVKCRSKIKLIRACNKSIVCILRITMYWWRYKCSFLNIPFNKTLSCITEILETILFDLLCCAGMNGLVGRTKEHAKRHAGKN